MAGQTTWNKATVAAGTDPYNLVPDTKKAIDTAGLVFGVADDTEKAGLAALAPGGVLPVPTHVFQTDKKRWFTWDGAVWTTTGSPYHAEFSGPIGTTVGGSGEGPGTLVVEATKTIDGSFVDIPGSGQLRVLKAGTYSGSFMVLPTTSPGTSSVEVTISGAKIGIAVGGDYGGKEVFTQFGPRYLAANTVISFTLVTTNSITYGSYVTITKLS